MSSAFKDPAHIKSAEEYFDIAVARFEHYKQHARTLDEKGKFLEEWEFSHIMWKSIPRLVKEHDRILRSVTADERAENFIWKEMQKDIDRKIKIDGWAFDQNPDDVRTVAIRQVVRKWNELVVKLECVGIHFETRTAWTAQEEQ